MFIKYCIIIATSIVDKCSHRDVIHHLIQEWRFDHATILSSDTKEDFNTYYYPAPVYGPPNYRPPNTNPPEPIYIPKPQYPLNSFHGPNNAYIPPKFKPAINFTSSVFLEKGYVYQQPPHQFVNYKYSSAPNYYSAPNENWKRSVKKRVFCIIFKITLFPVELDKSTKD